MSHPEFYPDRISVRPGDDVKIHASSSVSPCRLSVTRIGRDETCVATFEDVAIGEHPVPEDADQAGCNWPVALTFKIGTDWATGYYDLTLSGPDGQETHHFLCVRPAKTQQGTAVLILATNTYMAYNYWGGSNAYANVQKFMAGEVTDAASRDGAIGRLSRMRPLTQTMFAPPPGAPRLVNKTRRGLGEMPIPGDMQWMMEHRPSPYDGSAGFLQKWEHVFVRWAEEAGYAFDYMTDMDFETEPDCLQGYDTVLVVGHSEYWSGPQRFALEDHVQAGAKLAIFSGNTCYWKVRWEDEGQTMVAHKLRGETEDPLWEDPDHHQDATHVWSHESFNAPEASLLGLSFMYGGYHRLCMCVARGSGGYTVYNDQHWALENSDLYYGDQIGSDLPLLGYENDGCPIRFEDGLPKADGGVGVPQDLDIIAIAPTTLAENPRNPFPPMIPPEDTEVLARIAYGKSDQAAQARLLRGHAVMASFTKGKGEVFNAGTTEWVHGLDGDDPFVSVITENVLRRFGMTKTTDV